MKDLNVEVTKKWLGSDWERLGNLVVREMVDVAPSFVYWKIFEKLFGFYKFKKKHKLSEEYIKCFKKGFIAG